MPGIKNGSRIFGLKIYNAFFILPDKQIPFHSGSTIVIRKLTLSLSRFGRIRKILIRKEGE
jgi:hypothetical protein